MEIKNDTICAISTGAGRAALALIRISGPDLAPVLKDLCQDQPTPSNRMASLRKIFARDGSILDEAVIVYFQGPNSFTGEDLVELSVHGNPILCDRILRDLVSRGTRLAKPGEFTLRAALSGKMSLHEVEALDLVLNAQTEIAVRTGIEAKLGGFESQTKEIREKTLDLAAEIEAQLDFSEADIGEWKSASFETQLSQLKFSLESWLNLFERNQNYLKQLCVALVGRPNAGKSSLFNRILGQDRAIVHETPGTTRDYLEVEAKIGGRLILLLDTAGFRNSEDPLERIGIERSFEAIQRADVLVWVSDDGAAPPPDFLVRIQEKRLVLVKSKTDISTIIPPRFLGVSSLKGNGMEALLTAIMGARDSDEVLLSPIFTQRQVSNLKDALGLISQIESWVKSGTYLELIAEHLRRLEALMEDLVGRKTHRELLLSILSRFCIGK